LTEIKENATGAVFFSEAQFALLAIGLPLALKLN
jgi:hypothetical protein